MRTQKVNISFSSYTDANLENKAQHIFSSMNGNANFPNPIPTLADLQNAITKYSTDLVAAASLDRTMVAEKNKSRQKVEILLSQLGMYVMFIANGDAAILTSSGYTLSKEPEPRHITNPGNVTLSNGITSGQLLASVKTVKGAKGYLHEITAEIPTDTTVWTSTPSSRSQFTFNNLEAGKKYWIRVAAIGSGEQIAYSPVTSQFVQ
jgi:hypothetical protein